MTKQKPFALILKSLRTSRKLTKAELARLTDCSSSAICQYESGVRIPTYDQLLKLKKALGCSWAELMQGVSLSKVSHTGRGFAISEFTDSYGVKFRIQKSSAASDDYIWLGPSNGSISIQKPKESGYGFDWVALDKKALQESLNTTTVLFNDNLHLSRKDVRKILPLLERFVETGDLD